MCKKCKKAFRKDMTEYEEADEYCPNCDNQYVCLIAPLRTGLRRWQDSVQHRTCGWVPRCREQMVKGSVTSTGFPGAQADAYRSLRQRHHRPFSA